MRGCSRSTTSSASSPIRSRSRRCWRVQGIGHGLRLPLLPLSTAHADAARRHGRCRARPRKRLPRHRSRPDSPNFCRRSLHASACPPFPRAASPSPPSCWSRSLAASGCSWFRKEDELYAQSPESRPLEVPPDLDLPRTDARGGDAELPRRRRRSTAAPAAACAERLHRGRHARRRLRQGRRRAGARSKASPSPAARRRWASTTSAYEGSNFLVRVSAVDAGAYVSAVDPRGLPATRRRRPVKLMAR